MRAAVLLPANRNLFLPLLEVSVRDFPYSAGVPATLKHRRSRGPVRKQRLTEGSGETADCITGSDVRRRFDCRTPCK
jgi:hypothetical protein